MIRVLFVCHGNICRSPMAEFLFRKMTEEEGLKDQFFISSCATSREEIGNPVYPPARRLLAEKGIDCSRKRARQMTRADYEEYDYILCMESYNVRNLRPFVGDDPKKKIHLLLEYAGSPRDISDPWYTGDFEQAYRDIMEGLTAFLSFLKENFIK